MTEIAPDDVSDESPPTAAQAARIRGTDELALILDLAVGDLTAEQLADKYGKKTRTIYNFKHDNRHKIAEQKRHLGNEMATLWIARKEMRVKVYELQADKNMGLIEQIEDEAAQQMDLPDSDKIARLQDRIFKALGAAAEELGHLPTRTPGEGPAPVQLRHTIKGVDLSEAWALPRDRADYE
jgi:gas vesicle protein